MAELKQKKKKCDKCKFYTGTTQCVEDLKSASIYLIKRQKAEIERLKCEMGKLLPKDCAYAVQMEVSNKLETQIRAEAVREFAERLKGLLSLNVRLSNADYLDISIDIETS